MCPRLKILLCLLCLVLTPPLYAQVLISAENDPNTPYSDIRPQDTKELNAVIKRMQTLVTQLQQEDLDPQQKQAALDELIRDHNYILRQHNTWLDWQKPQTVDSAALLLEKMTFGIAADLAPTPQSREQVLQSAPSHLELDPNQPQPLEHYDPPLLAPVGAGDKPQETAAPQARPAETVAGDATAVPTAPKPKPEHGSKQDDSDGRDVSVGKKVKVTVLADAQTTTDMQNDNTVLRDVTNDDGELVLFGDLHLWAGGALQLDSYWGEGLFTQAEGGDSDSKSYVRRGEGLLRASVFEHNEVMAQYDFDTKIFRNLYWRRLSKSSDRSLTVGNQKEPLALDYLVGSKFTTALEPSAPSSAFGSYRSRGLRYNGWAKLKSKDNPIKFWGDSSTFLTTSIGVFGKDIENTNDTDWAVTGRVTLGGHQSEGKGYHFGLSSSYRHGEYDRIAPRPGLEDVNRITLAQPDADTQAMVGVEGVFGMGSLHSQAEMFYSDYSGGEVDAEGWGGYGQVGWLFGGARRVYRPDWGVWAPINAANKQVFEVFGRFSLTHGNDDVNSSNDLSQLTVGGNWYYRQFRVSTNLILVDTKRDLNDEGSGHAIALRLQYLF